MHNKIKFSSDNVVIILSSIGIIIILFIFLSLSISERFENTNITYTIGIPSIPDDISHFNDLIRNINKQTKLPNDIIIALSQTSDLDAKTIEIELNKISKIPVKISNVINKAYSGINRNRVAKVSTSDYIIFIDADDLMHPQRVEIVDKVLKKYNRPVGLLHALTVRSKNWDKSFDKWEVWDGKKLYNYHKNIVPETKSFHLNTINVHHGHPIYSRKVFMDLQYTDMKRGQDVRMVRDVLNFYGNNNNNLHYINVPLSNYFPRKKINY